MRRRCRFQAFLSAVASAILVAALAPGCPKGELEPSKDVRDAAGDTGLDLGDIWVRTDLDVRSPDGTHACGFFPDTCPDGSNCYSVVIEGEIERRCLIYESGDAGDDCDVRRPARCGDGLRCFRGSCRPICDPDRPGRFGCSSGEVCLPVRTEQQRLPWGVCEPISDKCTLWPSEDCPEGENCYELPHGHRCRPYDDEAALGDSCRSSQECNDGQVCVRRMGDNASGSVCRAKCDAEHPCERGSCAAISNLDYGACFPNADAG